MPEINKIPSADQIKTMYQKMEQNESEKKNFEVNLHDVVQNHTKINKPLTIGTTPNSLVICGANAQLDFTISKKVIDKCLRPEIRDSDGKLSDKTGHGLSEKLLSEALENVKNPIMILKGNRPDSLVVVTNHQDNQARPILVSVILNKMGNSAEINDVTSAYGRKGFAEFIEKEIGKGTILAADKEKANELFQSIGKKYPEPDTIISFDDSIAYTTANVKFPNQESERDQQQDKPLTGKETAREFNSSTSQNHPESLIAG